MDSIEELKKQHVEGYKNAIIEIIKNNTRVLVEEDILSLIKKPPLDSMDQIRIKFLDLAKRNKIVLITDNLDKMIDKYRTDLEKKVLCLKEYRVEQLLKNVVVDTNKMDVTIKFCKKDFTMIDKYINNTVKDGISEFFISDIESKFDLLFDDIDDSIKNKFVKEITKYFKTTYKKQLLENIEIKVLVKNTTLMNGVNEQSERYLFTISNSRLFTDY